MLNKIHACSMYAGRKRRKPVQRTVKQPASEGTKSNPSKRHRDRLNSELERLANLLPFPEEVTSTLDKLSILRLSVSYLRAKNFFRVAVKNHNCNGVASSVDNHDCSKTVGLPSSWNPESELLLQALNGFVLVITADGIIFYSSHTIQDYLGFHQTDVMHQSVFELVHTEDQQELRKNLHWAFNPSSTSHSAPLEASQEVEQDCGSSLESYNPEELPPENSSFLERSFVCRFRCLLDNSSGFLALNLQGRLKFLHGQSRCWEEAVKAPPKLALFAIASPLLPPSILEIRTKNMIFRTKHKLDFTPMACDAKGKIVLGYTEAELRARGSGYQFIHAADMLYCAENHVRMMKTGESGLTVFRLLTKDNNWKWVQANARLVYKNGKPDYIIATQRPLVEEEGGEYLRQRSLHLPFTFTTGEATLYHTSHPISGYNEDRQSNAKTSSKSKKGRTDSKDILDPCSLLGALMSQDESVYVCQPALEPKMSFQSSLLGSLEELPHIAHCKASEALRDWSETENIVLTPGLPESTFDPLLDTLESLCLGGKVVGDLDGCSNRELFSALDGLGLSAEDLELLLLDERMIRVEMDPDRVPTLDDLLTNDEILTYIHDSLEQKMESQVPSTSTPTTLLTATTTGPETCPTSSLSVQGRYVTPRPPLIGQQPIVQLSQQMQQHLGVTPAKAALDTWGLGSHSKEHVVKRQEQQDYSRQESDWLDHPVATRSSGLDNQCNKQKMSVQNGETTEQHQQYLQERQHGEIPHLHPQYPTVQRGYGLNGVYPMSTSNAVGLDHAMSKDYMQVYNHSHQGQTTNGHVYFYDANSALTGTAVNACVDYSLAAIPCLNFTINSGLPQETGANQGTRAAVASYQKGQEQLAQVLSSFSQQILGDGPTRGQIPTQDPFEMFMSESHDAVQSSKMENGCIPNVGYAAGSALPNGSAVTLSSGVLAHPEAIPSLPDPQPTGFLI
ncbi:aryl hydrocarbon receptor-like [Chanos chanos]|uniref:Aryl hydrocarbon receptor n=1 Tax=Chanos chanos TaxID=29144 RepID=A0A6J2WD96_CHACN|nr:aryl hydrocarbon receptor-like [Chanos chanos]